MAVVETTEYEVNVTLIYDTFIVTTRIGVPIQDADIDPDFDWYNVTLDGNTLERVIADIAGGSGEVQAFFNDGLRDVLVEPLDVDPLDF